MAKSKKNKARLEQRSGVKYWDYQKQQPVTAKKYWEQQAEQAKADKKHIRPVRDSYDLVLPNGMRVEGKTHSKSICSDFSDGDLAPEERVKLAKLKAELEAMHTAFVTYWGEALEPVDLVDGSRWWIKKPETWQRRWDGTKRPDPPLDPAKRWRLIKRFKRLNKLRDKIISTEAHEEAQHQAH